MIEDKVFPVGRRVPLSPPPILFLKERYTFFLGVRQTARRLINPQWKVNLLPFPRAHLNGQNDPARDGFSFLTGSLSRRGLA